MEPKLLLRGKEFHNRVQADWKRTAKGGRQKKEKVIDLVSESHHRKGRMDIFIEQTGDYVAIVEIRSTDWDRIKPQNRKKVLSSHRRQVWKYIEQMTDVEKVDVCPGVIYPRAPKTAGLQEEVEEYLNDYGLQVVWYDD